MSNVNPFATQVTQSGSAVSGQGSALSGAKTGVTASVTGGGAFWQFLFSLVGEEGAGKDKELFSQIAQSPETVAEKAKHKLNEGQPLSLPEIVVMLQEQDKDIPVDFKELNIEEVAAKIDALNKEISDMIAALPADSQSNPFAEILVGRLQHRLEDLQTSLDAIESINEEQFTALISFGLTPQQLTEAATRIHDVEEKIGRTLTAEDLIAGVGGILQPVSDEATHIQPTDDLAKALNEIVIGSGETAGDNENIVLKETALGLQDSQTFAFEESTDGDEHIVSILPAGANPVLKRVLGNDLSNLSDQTEADDQIAAQLNALNVGSGNALPDGVILPEGEISGYKGLDLAAKPETSAANLTNAAQKAVTMMKTAFASLINAQTTAGGEFTTSQGFFSAFFDSTAELSADQDLATILPMTHAAQAAHSVTAIPQAGHTHPATQLVSATISKMAKDGTPKSMRIELDPPELGRVNVTLEFGPEKTAKIHVLAEKPETYLMLQRDAALLERALQDTGLNTDSASLSFELAEDGSAFDPRDNNDANGSNGKNADADGQDDLDIIQSTVNWQVDPETGLTRYNLVV